MSLFSAISKKLNMSEEERAIEKEAKNLEKYIMENYGRKGVREMSRDLGYSDKWVKQLIKKLKLKEESFI